jgi:hypothetical protein
MNETLPIQFSGEEIRTMLPPIHYGSIADSSNVLGPYTMERRSSMRFPMELDADISTSGDRFRGRTINISSGGLLVSCGDNIEVGTLVTIRIGWPMPQRNKRVTLVVHGEIIRREMSRIAIRQQRHEFEVSSLAATSHSSPFSLNHTRRLLSSALELIQGTRRWVGHSINCPPLTSTVSPTT